MKPPVGYFTIDAAAAASGLSRNTVARLARSGKVAAVDVAGRLYVSEQSLLAHLQPKPVVTEAGHV